MKLDGVFAPLTTPFATDGTVAIERLRENVTKYNATRLAGYVAMGSTGEAVLLSKDETERVLAAIRETAGANKILIAGTGAESTAETIERTARAARMGYQVALIKPPYYYKPLLTPQVLIEHFERVADAAPIPILLYAVPQFTGIAFEAPLVARLAEHANIIGIKESSANVQRIGEIVQGAPRNFRTLVGSAATIHPSVAVGAQGCILALACDLPDLCIEVFELARAGDMARALGLQQRLIPVSKKIVTEGGAPGVKYAMDLLGYWGGLPRRPLLPPSEAHKKEIEGILHAVKAIPAESAHG